MSTIAVRPEDQANTPSPLERKKNRVRPLIFERKALDAVASASMAYLAELGTAARTK